MRVLNKAHDCRQFSRAIDSRHGYIFWWTGCRQQPLWAIDSVLHRVGVCQSEGLLSTGPFGTS